MVLAYYNEVEMHVCDHSWPYAARIFQNCAAWGNSWIDMSSIRKPRFWTVLYPFPDALTRTLKLPPSLSPLVSYVWLAWQTSGGRSFWVMFQIHKEGHLEIQISWISWIWYYSRKLKTRNHTPIVGVARGWVAFAKNRCAKANFTCHSRNLVPSKNMPYTVWRKGEERKKERKKESRRKRGRGRKKKEWMKKVNEGKNNRKKGRERKKKEKKERKEKRNKLNILMFKFLNFNKH